MTQIAFSKAFTGTSSKRTLSDILISQIFGVLQHSMEMKEFCACHKEQSDHSQGKSKKRRKSNKKRNGRAASLKAEFLQQQTCACKLSSTGADMPMSKDINSTPTSVKTNPSDKLCSTQLGRKPEQPFRQLNTVDNVVLCSQNKTEGKLSEPSASLANSETANISLKLPSSNPSLKTDSENFRQQAGKENSVPSVSCSENKFVQNRSSNTKLKEIQPSPEHSSPIQNLQTSPRSQTEISSISVERKNVPDESARYMRHKQLLYRMKTLKQLINDTTEKATLARDEVINMKEKAETAFREDDVRSAFRHKMRVNVMKSTIKEAQSTQQKFYEMYKTLREEVIANQSHQNNARSNTSQSLRDVGRV